MTVPRILAMELSTLGSVVEVTGVEVGVVTRTPTRRDYHGGHAVFLHEPPADLDPALSVWREHHAGVEGIEKVVIQWEAPRGWEPSEELREQVARLGAELDRSDLMQLGELRRVPGMPEVTARVAASDTDWACIGVLQRWMDPETAPDFWRWMGATGFRDAAEAGHATAWLVHRHAEPAAAVVLGRTTDPTGYVGSVVTHPAHRGRGLASALTHHACEVHRFRHPDDDIYLAADRDSGAQRVYERLGFRTVAHWWEVAGDAGAVRPPGATSGGGEGAG